MCDAMLSEIQGTTVFLRSRVGMMSSGRAQESLLQSIAHALIKVSVHCDNLGPLEATRLTDALKSDRRYGESGTPPIIAVIDVRIHPTTSRALRARGTSKGQLLVHWRSYLTKGELATLKDQKKSLSVKMATLVGRGNLLGVVCCDEHTYG